MKKLYSTLIAALVGFSSYGQCSPNTTYSDPGIYPPAGSTFRDDSVYVLPSVQFGASYSQVIDILVPVDSTIELGAGVMITADIDSMRIVGFNNMPSWLSYTCNNSRCSWLGGDYGCIQFTGTAPSSANTWLMEANLEVTADLGSFGQIIDTVPVWIEVSVGTVSLEEVVSSNALRIGPNPIVNHLNIQYSATQSQNWHFDLMDVTGRIVHAQSGRFSAGENKIQINRNNWPEGMYLYRMRVNGEVHTGRLVVNNGI